jgi:hypothetical protein
VLWKMCACVCACVMFHMFSVVLPLSRVMVTASFFIVQKEPMYKVWDGKIMSRYSAATILK